MSFFINRFLIHLCEINTNENRKKLIIFKHLTEKLLLIKETWT